MIAKKGIAFLQRLYLRLCTLAGVSPSMAQALLRLWSMSDSRTASAAAST